MEQSWCGQSIEKIQDGKECEKEVNNATLIIALILIYIFQKIFVACDTL